MKRFWLLAVLAVLALGAMSIVASTLQSQEDRKPQCPSGNYFGFINNLQTGLAADAGYATEEEAVNAEADRELNSHDRTRRESDGRYTVEDKGRRVGDYSVQRLTNGRYEVSGGVTCDVDRKNRDGRRR